MTRRRELTARLEALIASLESPTSSPTSPIPSTTPIHSSDDLVTMMRTMGEIFAEERKETRAMVLDILQGRATEATGQLEMPTIERERLTNYDDDPLPPELEAVMSREMEETLAVQASLRERSALQQRAAELQTDLSRLQESEDYSPVFSESGIRLTTDD